MRSLLLSVSLLAAACGGKSSTPASPPSNQGAPTAPGPFAGGCTKGTETTLPPGECGSRCYDADHQLTGSNYEPTGVDDASCAAAALAYCTEVHSDDSVSCQFIRN